MKGMSMLTISQSALLALGGMKLMLPVKSLDITSQYH